MRVIKPQRLGLMTKTMPHNGAGLFIVSTFSLFDLVDPNDILAETAMWPMVAKALPKGTVFDAAYPKPFGEFLIAGSAMSQEPVKAMRVAVTVGDQSRHLSVFGDRFWETTGDGPVFSEPLPFTEMPLSPDRAFGGEGHVPNPLGQGANAPELSSSIPRLPLPNVEVSGSEIRSIGDRPEPALIGPIALEDPARLALAGTFNKAWVAQQMPDWPSDFDPRFYMSAPPQQRRESFFEGDEAVRVVGMSAREPDLQTHLPGIRARAFVTLGAEEAHLTEISMRTDTVWIFGSEMKGVVINRGMLEVSDLDGRDVSAVMVAYERTKDAPRETGYYQRVFDLRSDPDEAHKYLLADGQLSPEEDPVEVERREQDRIAAAEDRLEKWTEGRQWRLERHFSDHGLPISLIPAIDEPDVKQILLPSAEDVARGDVDIARLLSDVEDLRQEADLKSGMVNAEIHGVVRQLGLEPPVEPQAELSEIEKLGQSTDIGKGFLPAFEDLFPSNTLDKMLEDFEAAPKSDLQAPEEPDPQATFEKAKARFLKESSAGLLSAAKDMLENNSDELIPPTAETPLFDVSPTESALVGDEATSGTELADEAIKLDDYLTNAFPSLAGAEDASPTEKMRSAVSGLAASDATPAESIATAKAQVDDAEENLEEALASARRTAAEAIAPLEPMGPQAAELLGAFVCSHLADGGSLLDRDIAGASLVALSLENADFTGSFLENCDLSGAALQRAVFVRAALTGARLTEADFSQGDFSQANLSSVLAARATFKQATFKDATFIGADFSDCDFSGATFENCTFIECKLPNARLSSATLKECSFARSDLSAIKANGAQLEETNFLSVQLDHSDWTGAALKKAAFADVSFKSSVLANASLNECGWFGATDMSGSNFSNVDAVKCGFQDAVMRESALVQAVFDGCNFASSDFELADMRLSSFKGSIFAFSRITKADLFGANLREATFRGADLTKSSFRAANLFRADLSEASIAFSDFTHSNLQLTNMEGRP